VPVLVGKAPVDQLLGVNQSAPAPVPVKVTLAAEAAEALAANPKPSHARRRLLHETRLGLAGVRSSSLQFGIIVKIRPDDFPFVTLWKAISLKLIPSY
jgi:hypothetical protein